MITNDYISYPTYQEYLQNSGIKYETETVENRFGEEETRFRFKNETDELIAKGGYERLIEDNDVLMLIRSLLIVSQVKNGKLMFGVFDLLNTLNLIYRTACETLGADYKTDVWTDTAGLVILMLGENSPPCAKRLARFLITDSQIIRSELKSVYRFDYEKAIAE